MKRLFAVTIFTLALPLVAQADAIRQTKGDFYDAFRQLDVDLPTPNVYRSASGAPGPLYWQQRVDYDIEVVLDEKRRHITASETVRYTNNSPDTLRYLWIQLDQNRFRRDSLENKTRTATDPTAILDKKNRDVITFGELAREQASRDEPYGFEIGEVTDSRGRAMPHTIVDTMMRIDLPEPLAPGARTSFSIDWSFYIVDNPRIGARSGFEHFPETDSYIYFIAQWFPRLAAYTDYMGWQHKAFIGRGEFTLEFGDYKVAITVPFDHIVSASGELQNASDVLSSEQRQRLAQARRADRPLFIVTPEEAAENEKEASVGTRTWVFKADNVRDFAWASSRKFIWDAMIHRQEDRRVPEVLAMSFYPNEAEPIWSQYSTHAVVHTMEVYSRFSFPYPYPTAQSVNTWKSGGMEYPMITFNGYRPEPFEQNDDDPIDNPPDNTYSRRIKYGLIGVIIHEIGHVYFPMTVNSDERQWTWMDEGINSFLEYLAEVEWEDDFPAYRPEISILDYIVPYMLSENQVPIMTNSESIPQFFDNAYSKPTAALIVLRETVMGRELFDFAFKEYSTRWKFRRPTPADLFRTMEDASGVDLDWFWRGWFYSTDHVEVAISDVREYQVSSKNPDTEFPLQRDEDALLHPETLTQQRNREEGRTTRVERMPELDDFYNEHDRFTPSNEDRNSFSELLESLEDQERETLRRAIEEKHFVYFIDFVNSGGLPTPLPLSITNADGSKELMMVPAEIWRRNHRQVTKLLIRDKAMTAIELDPRHETADTDFSNNHFPRRIAQSRIDLYKAEEDDRDLMRGMLQKLREAKGQAGSNGHEVPLEPAQREQ
ncbi:MAG: M1 family metallopeptidase [Gammaproteobacteria bacterium]|nr:M1 family metallopeptidase [Gammaproteobacteria bacterium]